MASSALRTVASSGVAGSSTNRFTPNGRSVSARIAATSLAIFSGESAAPARKPRPPAFDTAATIAGVVAPPAIGACTTGTLNPKRSANGVTKLPSLMMISFPVNALAT